MELFIQSDKDNVPAAQMFPIEFFISIKVNLEVNNSVPRYTIWGGYLIIFLKKVISKMIQYSQFIPIGGR